MDATPQEQSYGELTHCGEEEKQSGEEQESNGDD